MKVLVLSHSIGGRPTGGTREALGAAKRLAQGDADVVVVIVVGAGAAGMAPQLIAAGASAVYTVQDPSLAEYQSDAYLQVMMEAAKRVQPSIVLMPHDDVAKDLAPKLAFRLQAGLTMDCVDLALNNGKLVATKPVYGGNALAVFETDTPRQMATLRAKAFEPLPDDPSRQGTVEPLRVDLDPGRHKVRVVEVRREAASGARLEDADVVVAGGRGLGSAAAFKQLEELAAALGGAVGATRAVCDAGWVPHSMQVGLTGKTVAPNLYIAVGISGASQHMAGCSGSRTIVAINKDKASSIFKEASYGVAAPWQDVLPSFIKAVKELRKG